MTYEEYEEELDKQMKRCAQNGENPTEPGTGAAALMRRAAADRENLSPEAFARLHTKWYGWKAL